MHTNFSTKYMREVGGKEYFEALMDAFERYMEEHIEVYGPDNHLRLTGLHETQSIDTFSWGVADRGASIRVPHSFVSNGYRGYLEDRRPNSQGDPYRIAGRILETIATGAERAARRTATRAELTALDARPRARGVRTQAGLAAHVASCQPSSDAWRYVIPTVSNVCFWRGRRRLLRCGNDASVLPREPWGFFCWSSEEDAR